MTHAVIWRNQSARNALRPAFYVLESGRVYVQLFRRNGAGVAVMFSHQVRDVVQFFEDNWGEAAYGLLLKEISDSQIDGNYFTATPTACIWKEPAGSGWRKTALMPMAGA